MHDFSLTKVLIDWKDGPGFCISDALTGCFITGATGSGKTSGPGNLIARAYLKAQFGGVVLCYKNDEAAAWQTLANEAGRADDVIVIDASGAQRFNFLAHEAERGAEGAGLAINVVALLDETATAIDTGGASDGEGGGDNAFFRAAHRHMLINLVQLPMLAGLPISLPLMRAIANSAPLSLAQCEDPNWRKVSACWQVLREAEAATRDDPQARADFEECREYFEVEFPGLSDRTRSVITLMFSMLVRPFITRPMRRLFCEDTTVTPDDALAGKLIIVNLPVQEYKLAGRLAAIVWKYSFQNAVLRRKPGREPLRPVFIWADEAQMFVTERDAEYQAVCRSSGGATVYLTQQRESFRRVLKSDDATENLLANLQFKAFCQNVGQTNDWASDLLGSRLVKITTTNISRSGQHGKDGFGTDINAQGGVSRSEDWRPYLPANRFASLKRGGELNNFHVEAVIFQGGRMFQQEGGEPLPYKIVTFRQR